MIFANVFDFPVFNELFAGTIKEMKDKFNVGLDSINIAPEFGQLETLCYLEHMGNDIEEYYPLFKKLFIERGGLEMMENGQYIMYPVHATKSKIKAKFPNARIEEIIPDNGDHMRVVVGNYLNTTAKFPAYLKLSDFRPNYLTSYAKRLEENKDAIIRDLFEGTDEEYKMYVYETIKNLVQKRKNENKL